jgi:hypothetical protein
LAQQFHQAAQAAPPHTFGAGVSVANPASVAT